MPSACLPLAGFAAFFQLPLSIPFWTLLPDFQYVLFAYRLLPLLALATLLLLFEEGTAPLTRKLAIAALLCATLLPCIFFLRLLPFQHFASIRAAEDDWRQGFRGVREYVPVTAPATWSELFQQESGSPRGAQTRNKFFKDTSCAPHAPAHDAE